MALAGTSRARVRRGECEAVNVADALTLILCFPVMGLLLFTLTAIEEWLSDQPPSAHPSDEAGQETGPGPAGRGALVRWPADRSHRRQSPVRQAPAAGRQYRQAG